MKVEMENNSISFTDLMLNVKGSLTWSKSLLSTVHISPVEMVTIQITNKQNLQIVMVFHLVCDSVRASHFAKMKQSSGPFPTWCFALLGESSLLLLLHYHLLGAVPAVSAYANTYQLIGRCVCRTAAPTPGREAKLLSLKMEVAEKEDEEAAGSGMEVTGAVGRGRMAEGKEVLGLLVTIPSC